MGILQLRRLPTEQRLLIIPALSEPIWDLNQKRLYIGDGITPGGICSSNDTRVTDEHLTGSINGFNKVFTTSSEFISNSVEIYINGLKQRNGIDFEVTGENEVTLSDAPTNIGFPDYLTASYSLV